MGRTTLARSFIEAIRVGAARKEDLLRHLEEGAGGAEALRAGQPAVAVQVQELRDGSYHKLGEAHMYEMTDADRVDVLRFGRQPGQDFQLLDGQVSREHGLVIYAGELPLFCDYGTLKEGAHAGSLNGTYVSGKRVRDTMIHWLPIQELLLGPTTRDAHGHTLHRFKVSYKLLRRSRSA